MKLTVQPGDTLGRLTQLALNQAAPDAGGGRLPFSQLMQKVQAVAAQNQITDPDRIFPGQVIDFSTALSVPATRQGGVSNNAAEPMAPAVSKAPVLSKAPMVPSDPSAHIARTAPNAAAPSAAPVTSSSSSASPHRLLEQTLSRAVARGYIPAKDLPDVRRQILEMSRTYGFAPNDFARVALIESDGFNPKASNGNCHGVIQFCDGNDRGAASVGFGKNPRAILNKSVLEQLALVDEYFKDTGLQNYKAPSLETLYLTVLFPAARDESLPHRPLPIPGPQAAALHVGGSQDGPITRASVRRGLVEHANLRLAQFAKEQAREASPVVGPLAEAPARPVTEMVSGPPEGSAGRAVAASAGESITGSIPRLPPLLPNFSVPSVSTQSVLQARRQT